MGLPAEKIIAEALELPRSVRALVAERLIESLDFEEPLEISVEWREEIRRRCKEIDEGTAELLDGDEVFARLYASVPGKNGLNNFGFK
jgi:putative addiction module component (TIGR02574 family)